MNSGVTPGIAAVKIIVMYCRSEVSVNGLPVCVLSLRLSAAGSTFKADHNCEVDVVLLP